ncbi:HAUS augmin-like complex subunit 2 [Myripristis murdjan]|uniref:Uncharacterized protein n=1 Tax=Myripristis murdjan TaxID=586833 RepID=A0A667Y5L8_9TELE|nr:HAUS augmin-like complex subunit 2 [Myripristis murdjan]XP_029900125.1 HAUS augmin-like complex subunit 2 [Myripristis murdjan]
MDPSDVCVFSVSPAARVLARCVSRGALSQEAVDSACRQSRCVSWELQEAEEQMGLRRRLDQLQLQLELLKAEQENADVTHTFHLSGRFQVLQDVSRHLQQVLQQHSSLSQRLMRPLARSSLPVQAQLHRCVVQVVKMQLDFIRNLEENLSTVQSRASCSDAASQLSSSVVRLLAQVVEVQNLSNQILRWKEVSGSVLTESSASSEQTGSRLIGQSQSGAGV